MRTLSHVEHEVSPQMPRVSSSGIQVHPDPEDRARFLRDNAVGDLFYPDRRVESLGAREGFPVLTLAPQLQTFAESKGTFLHGFEPHLGFGQWNESGHEFAGEQIARWLAPQLTASELQVTQEPAGSEISSLY